MPALSRGSLPPQLPPTVTPHPLPYRFEALWAVLALSLKFRKLLRRRTATLHRIEGAVDLLPEEAEADRAVLKALASAVEQEVGGRGKGAAKDVSEFKVALLLISCHLRFRKPAARPAAEHTPRA